MFSSRGPSLRELCIQALSSVERGYDDLAPKFDHTPFRTPDGILEAVADALSDAGPFGTGLDVCCGTGAGLGVLRRLCRQRITGVDFSSGMLAQARSASPDAFLVRADARALPFASAFDLAVTLGALGHFLPSERGALFEGVHRALRPGGLLAVPVGTPSPLTSATHWVELGFDLAMLVRNTVVRPPFVMYYHTHSVRAIRRDLTEAGFTLDALALTGPGGHPPWSLLLARKAA